MQERINELEITLNQTQPHLTNSRSDFEPFDLPSLNFEYQIDEVSPESDKVETDQSNSKQLK
jgi:hypothetical protein